MKYKDYYAVLGLPRDANLDQVKRAYRTRARQFHPDVSKAADAEVQFKNAAEAYATLKDPDRRSAYDQLARPPSGADFSPLPQWRQAHPSGWKSFEDLDMADLMAAMGRNGQGTQRAPVPMQGRHYDSTVQISLEQAQRGCHVLADLAAAEGRRSLDVQVPPGVHEGQKIRMRGQGGKGGNGGDDGDIFVRITLAPHAVFRPDQLDLYFDLALSPWEAALGAEIAVPTLDGSVMLTVPAGTPSGRKLRLRGRGLAQGSSDLYAIVHVDVPVTLSARERALFLELSRISDFNPRTVAPQGELHETSTS